MLTVITEKMLIFTFLLIVVEAYDVCKNNKAFCSNHIESNKAECNTDSYNVKQNECSTINFDISKNMQDLNDIKLRMWENGQLFVIFDNVMWRKSYIKLVDYLEDEKFTCKMYTLDPQISTPLHNEIVDSCFLNSSTVSGRSYYVYFKSENKRDVQTNSIVFTKPKKEQFGSNIPIQNRSIFTYVDFTDNYYLKLKIQPLPEIYDISSYKVQVFRMRDKKSEIVESKSFDASSMDIINFDYYTYNEVGEYYFAISVRNQKCAEDACFITLTPLIHVGRKSTALVIGIVGASLIIPFVLFLFHMVNKKCRQTGEIPSGHQKIVFIFKSSSKLHGEVINTLAKVLQDLTGAEVVLEAFKHSHKGEKICSDDVLYASHVVYIPPPQHENPYCEMDFMTYNFLKDELKKKQMDKTVIIVRLPYSNNEIPDILKFSRSFLLMDEFDLFLKCFDVKLHTRESPSFLDLIKSIEAAKIETESKIKIKPPKIIITEQSDCSDMESEGLL